MIKHLIRTAFFFFLRLRLQLVLGERFHYFSKVSQIHQIKTWTEIVVNHLVGVVTITWKFVWNNLLADLVWSPRRQIHIMTPSMLSLVQTKASIVEEETHWYGVSLRGRYARVSQSKAIKHKYIGLSYKSWEFLHHCFSAWIILLLTLLRNNSSFLSYECSFFSYLDWKLLINIEPLHAQQKTLRVWKTWLIAVDD